MRYPLELGHSIYEAFPFCNNLIKNIRNDDTRITY